MFFRKKRYNEVEGYDRITRIVGENAAEGDELFEEDTVLLTREGADAVPHARDSPQARDSIGREALADESDAEESVTVVRTAPVVPPAPPISSVTPAPMPALPSFSAPFESPRMSMPDLGTGASLNGASLVAKDAVWEGKLVCTGNVRIEGTLRGEVESDGTLFVAADAQVDGTVRARNVTLAGEIKGDLHCAERLEILPGGAARGEVDTGTLVVHEGAFIDSRFQMQREPAAR